MFRKLKRISNIFLVTQYDRTACLQRFLEIILGLEVVLPPAPDDAQVDQGLTDKRADEVSYLIDASAYTNYIVGDRHQIQGIWPNIGPDIRYPIAPDGPQLDQGLTDKRADDKI